VTIQAAARDRIVMIGHLMVFHPAVVRWRELLGSGELGALHYMTRHAPTSGGSGATRMRCGASGHMSSR